jgi:UDP-N-acetylmuramate--alanine ligase
MSAYAVLLAQMGHRVSGSDLRPDPAVAERLRASGVTVHGGHQAENLPPDLDAVAASTAIGIDNPEVAEATRRGVPLLSRADLLSAIASRKDTVAVAGTHGKTTTTAMLALALDGAGMHPSFAVGADVPGLDNGARWDDAGRLLVVEADESDRTFLAIPRVAAIVQNVESDHLGAYEGSPEVLHDAFRRFAAETPGPVIASADDPVAGTLPGAITYGTTRDAQWRLDGLETARLELRFRLTSPDHHRIEVTMPATGEYNAYNAAASLVTAAVLGADLESAAAALGKWTGVARRFERRGQLDGVTVIDDYAHLPGEVRAVLAAARAGGWQRIVCVFQPHRHTRTLEVHADFAGAFDDADVLVVTGIYQPAGASDIEGVTGRLVFDAARHPNSRYVERRTDVVDTVRPLLRPGDLLMTVGAGDITDLAVEMGVEP